MREEATECFGASCRLLVYPAAQKSHLLHRIVRDVMSIWGDALPVSGDRLQPWTHTQRHPIDQKTDWEQMLSHAVQCFLIPTAASMEDPR